MIADIHYDYRMALACLDAATPSGRPAVDKIRINPGNIGGEERFKEVVRKARDKGIPMRIGVNSGSLEKDLIDKYGFPCPEAMVESALRHIETAERLGYKLMIISLKASHVPTAVECYTQYAAQCDYPTHVGITEAGSREYGTLKSAAGHRRDRACAASATRSASRCWATRSPRSPPGFDILRACDRRVTKPEVVACPTCGRLDIDLERIVAEVEDKMKDLKNPLRISILGCLVNGFGEAKEADLGIAAGAGKGIIFKRGVPIRHVKEAEMVAGPARGSRAIRRRHPAPRFVHRKREAKAAKTRPARAELIAQHSACSYLPQADRDVLGFEIGVEPLDAQLAAQARFLHAAERALGRRRDRVVDADDARFEALGHAGGDRQVVGEDIGRQAVGRVVGGGDHVVELGEIEQRHDRGERLLGHDLHVIVDLAKHRRLEPDSPSSKRLDLPPPVKTLPPCPGRPRPAQRSSRAPSPRTSGRPGRRAPGRCRC